MNEVDVVGYDWQTLGKPLPAGVKLIGTRRIGDSLVARFSLTRGRRVTPATIAAGAPGMLGPAAAGSTVLVQSPGTIRG